MDNEEFKEYMEEYNLKEDNWGDEEWTEKIWNNERFKVTVKVEGQNDKIYDDLKAGDHWLSLGSFSEEGKVKFFILCKILGNIPKALIINNIV